MNLYKSLVRPVLFRMRPERAQEVSKFILKRRAIWRTVSQFTPVEDEILKTNLAGIPLQNPVGLAGGFDKYCELLGSIMDLGFGYAIPGSIVSSPREDNPRPIYVRYPDRESMANCTGIPSRGLEYTVKQLRKYAKRKAPIIANIADFSSDGFLRSFEALQPLVDAVEVCLICPNEKYSEFCPIEEDTFERLLGLLAARKTKPMLVKIRNYHDAKERDSRLELVRACIRYGVDGITIPGSVTVNEPSLSLGKGNLTGRAVYHNTLRNIVDIMEETQGKMAIKALGGIFRAEHAFEAIQAGATTVETVTGLIYEGPFLAKNMARGLVRMLKDRKFASIQELRAYRKPRIVAA